MGSTKGNIVVKNDPDLNARPQKSSTEKKAILEEQIRELKCLKDEVNRVLRISNSIPEKKINDLSIVLDDRDQDEKNQRNDDFLIKNELFMFSGVRCVKVTTNEYVFHFYPTCASNKNHVYSVQFFKIDNKGELGKWTMPQGLDIDVILKETPIENISYGVQFLRNCKHHIDCYVNRMDQFNSLKESLGGVTKCSLNQQQGYTHIIFDIRRVFDNELDDFIDITLYLEYNLKETRPQRMRIEAFCGATLQREKEKRLKLYFKCFKKLTLIEAFGAIGDAENQFFHWDRITNDLTEESENSYSEVSSEEYYEPIRKRRRQNAIKKSIGSQNKLRTSILVHAKKSFPKENLKQKKGTNEVMSKKTDTSDFLRWKLVESEASEKSDTAEFMNDKSLRKFPPLEGRSVKVNVEKTTMNKKIQQEDFILKAVSEAESPNNERILRSKISSRIPQRVEREATEKVPGVTPQTIKSKMKQTLLKFQNPAATGVRKNISEVPKSDLLNSNVITSTPVPVGQQIQKRSFDTTLDISEIRSNTNLLLKRKMRKNKRISLRRKFRSKN